jgi:hypothetical protein
MVEALTVGQLMEGLPKESPKPGNLTVYFTAGQSPKLFGYEAVLADQEVTCGTPIGSVALSSIDIETLRRFNPNDTNVQIKAPNDMMKPVAWSGKIGYSDTAAVAQGIDPSSHRVGWIPDDGDVSES